MLADKFNSPTGQYAILVLATDKQILDILTAWTASDNAFFEHDKHVEIKITPDNIKREYNLITHKRLQEIFRPGMLVYVFSRQYTETGDFEASIHYEGGQKHMH